MPKCIILSGIPCSGKSSWARKQNLHIISRDVCRYQLFGKNYKQNDSGEAQVNKLFKFDLDSLIRRENDIIVDNTNCRIRNIAYILKNLPPEYKVEYKRFDCPLYLAYIRNIIRYFKTGKFIPFKIIKQMKINYDKLWQLN